MNRYFKSIGRYGPSPFLVAQYGGIGEITQAFCRYGATFVDAFDGAYLGLPRLDRACAVHGGTYILGSQSKISDLQLHPTASQDGASHSITFSIPAHPIPITTDLLISGSPLEHPSIATAESTTSSRQANCIAILKAIPLSIKAAFAPTTSEPGDTDSLETTEMTQDVVLLIFPPGPAEAAPATAVRALLMGSGTGSCPADQCESISRAVCCRILITVLQSLSTFRPIWRTTLGIPRTCFFHTLHVFWTITQQSSCHSTRRPIVELPQYCLDQDSPEPTNQTSRPCL